MAKRKAAGQTIYDLLKGEFENLTIVLTHTDTDHVEWSELLKQFSEAGQRIVLVEGKRELDFFRIPHHGREVGRAFRDIADGLQPKVRQT